MFELICQEFIVFALISALFVEYNAIVHHTVDKWKWIKFAIAVVATIIISFSLIFGISLIKKVPVLGQIVGGFDFVMHQFTTYLPLSWVIAVIFGVYLLYVLYFTAIGAYKYLSKRKDYSEWKAEQDKKNGITPAVATATVDSDSAKNDLQDTDESSSLETDNDTEKETKSESNSESKNDKKSQKSGLIGKAFSKVSGGGEDYVSNLLNAQNIISSFQSKIEADSVFAVQRGVKKAKKQEGLLVDMYQTPGLAICTTPEALKQLDEIARVSKKDNHEEQFELHDFPVIATIEKHSLSVDTLKDFLKDLQDKERKVKGGK